MKHRLIIIDGQSSVGKSSISKAVFEQLSKQEECYWLHEECINHPIREGEFDAGDLHTAEGMEQNRLLMMSKWTQFRDDIMAKNQACITEGCFLHAIDRYLLESVWSREEMICYFKEVVALLEPLNPLFVFVHRPDIRRSLEKAFEARGDWWKNLILREPEPVGYFKTHEYKGDDSIFEQSAYEQNAMSEVFDALPADKVKIDTSEEQWDEYVREIVELEGCRFSSDENASFDLQKYCGEYRIEDGEDSWKISYDEKSKSLYTSLFWPYMPMKCAGQNVFELISFPVKLIFEDIDGVMKFKVEGNYDWDYNDRMFARK